MIGIIGCAVFLIVAIVAIMLLMSKGRQIKELKSKIEFAVEGDELMKVEIDAESDIELVADHFNTLVKKYQTLREKSLHLEEDRFHNKDIDGKIRDMEASLNQSTLLTDIGKQITSCLNVEEILHHAYRVIRSSMDIEEIELMFLKNDIRIFKSIDKAGKTSDHDVSLDQQNLSLMNWSLENKKEVFLPDAINDFAQYVFKPIISLTNKKPAAAICIPLFLHKKEIGAIGVMSMQTNAYNNYHMDFIKGLASYIAVAIDNSNVYMLLESSKKEIEKEKEKSDNLLLNILPEEVAEELKQKGHSDARSFEMVTVLFTDFVNFTGISENMSPENLVKEIDTCFQGFDKIVETYGLEKIKTIGDAYLAVSGLPIKKQDHATNAIKAALAMRAFMKEREGLTGIKLHKIRIGLNSGPLVAGIVGLKKFAYDIWGDTVNTAARMEQSSETGKINVSGNTYSLIKDQFKCEYRGKINAKNKGEIDMYFVEA